MIRTLLIGLILTLTLFQFAFSDVQEPKTGVSFPETITQDGSQLTLAGVGVRSKMMVKVYAGALYLGSDAKTALAQYKGQSVKPDQALYDAVADGQFARMFVLHFVRDVDSGKITEAFQESLEKSLDLKAAEIQKDVNSFLTASKVDMKEGQQLKIYLNGDKITVISPVGSSQAITNAKLAGGVARIWLGKNPVSEDLKKGMLTRLSQIL